MGLREAGKEERRGRILAAAARLVEDGGLEALTMRDLSTAAGVSYATVYNLVGSKEDVLVAVLEAGIAELRVSLGTQEPADPLDRSRRLVTGIVDHFAARPALYRPLVRAVHDPALGARGVPIRRRTMAAHEVAIGEAVEQGLLRDDLQVKLLARHVTLAVNGVIQRWAAGRASAAAFRAEAEYAWCVSLLGIAVPSTRTQLLARLQRCERTLARAAGRAA